MLRAYPEKLLDYFYHLDHAGEISSGAGVYTAEKGSQQQGDVVRLYVRVESGKIVAAKFKSYGSVATLAACEFVCRWLMDKSISESTDLMPEHILAELQLSKIKIHCAVLLCETIHELFSRDL